uniref:Uncharacterized protein n=1 Tax=Sphaerodactylus townsendi TaxID=933632 RepID=A0ACB8EKV8_9SAUR
MLNRSLFKEAKLNKLRSNRPPEHQRQSQLGKRTMAAQAVRREGSDNEGSFFSELEEATAVAVSVETSNVRSWAALAFSETEPNLRSKKPRLE